MTQEQLVEFFKRLGGSEYCNFRERVKGDPKSITWRCKGGSSQAYALDLLEKMNIPREEAEAFLQKCTEYGGHCDCEIVFNAEDRFITDQEENSPEG